MWKLKSILSGIILGTSLFIIFPEIAIYINEVFGLPIFRNIIYLIAGLSFCFISISFFVYSSHLFSKIGKGTPAPIEPPKLLVAEGLYRFTRNPIYIGYILAIVGEFFIFGHFLLLLYALGAIFFVHFYVVYVEEPRLKKRFGVQYVIYMKTVPRWVLKKHS
jgi:protein-S-isoprenylcysteine O-methyltransferase Ste14